MLTERLTARCKSAKFIGVGSVQGYQIHFTKKSKDNSGKATLVQTNNNFDIVYGVLFNVDDSEKEKLDTHEGTNDGGYIPKENFLVTQNDKVINTKTYIAPQDRCRNDLIVYDWYLGLVVSGARQHKIDENYISKIIKSNKVNLDTSSNETSKNKALKILEITGFKDIFSELKYQ